MRTIRQRCRRAGVLATIVSLAASVVVGTAAAPSQAAGAAARIEPWHPAPYRHSAVHTVAPKPASGTSDEAKAKAAGTYARAHDKIYTGAKGAQLPTRTTRAANTARTAGPRAGSGSNGKVLILDSTVTGGAGSTEAQEAAADGFGVDVVDAAMWSSMTAAQFSAYRAIILGDPTCSDESSVTAAEGNALTWGPVVNGNIEIIGSDPVYHATNTNPAIVAVTQRAVDFATAKAGATGAYISLSCYFESTTAPTHVSLLDGLDGGGSGFSVQGAGCSDSIHIEASSPALSGIDDSLLSNWNCSVHEYFDSWPARFGVLAVDTSAGSLYTGQDGTTGDPYILAFPGGTFQGTTENAGGGSLTGHSNNCQATASPVNCATGEFWHTFTDLSVPGRGPALDLTRTYSSAEAATASPFGYGWNSPYTMSLSVDSASGAVQVTQENGATTVFTPSSGGFTAPPRVYATLTQNSDGTWTFIRHQSEKFVFGANGRLTSISDRNGYTTVLTYDSSGRLATVSDPENRLLTVTYGSDGLISSVSDPAGRTTSYRYDAAGNLAGETDAAVGTWTFGYDANHLMTSMTDPRGGTVGNVYDSTGRVTSQTDAMGRTTGFAYSDSGTTVTEPDGGVTVQAYTQGQLVSVTKGSGTAAAATWQYTYDAATLGVATSTDPNGATTTYAYDGGGYQPTGVTDGLGRATTSTYNTFEEPLTVTDPNGETTTYTYDPNGNLLSAARPLAGAGSTQTTTYTYGDPAHPGDVTGTTDPDGKTTRYTYDTDGDLASTTDPAGDTTTYTYDAIGRRTGMVSPRGNAAGADASTYTTAYAYDAFGDLTTTTDPLGHVTANGYDADRDQTSATDADGNVTTYAYDLDGELTTTTRADGTKLTDGYDANGNRTTATDASGHATTYAYDALDRVVSSTDPLGRVTRYGYDGTGNRVTVTDPSGRTTTSGYDAANELTSVAYSDAGTPKVTYTYTPDGQRATMADGTGTTTYTYDSLNRLTATTDGAGQTIGYGYDLKGDVTGLTYPNGKTVSRAYDNAGRLTGVTDWLGNTTTFSYDAGGDLTGESYPNSVTATSTFDNAGRLTGTTDQSGGSTLASDSYTRDNAGQITTAASTGPSGSGSQGYGYDRLSQLTSAGGTPYGYDNSGDPTSLAHAGVQTFDAAGQLVSGATAGVTTEYGYDPSGRRTSATQSTGTSTEYGYDQSGDMTSVTKGSEFTPVTPARVVDTRPGSGQPYAGQTLAPNSTLTVQVAGRGGVPASATAVVVNMTIATASADTYLTAYPAGTPKPTASVLNTVTNAITNNQVTARLGSGGQLSVYNVAGRTDVVVDVLGYYGPSGSQFTPVTPTRVADTRPGSGEPAAGHTMAPGATLTVQITGANGDKVPANATGVTVEATVVNPASKGYLTVYPAGVALPHTSNLNYVAATNLTREVTVKLGTGGAISITNESGAKADLVIDVVGYYAPAGQTFNPLSPVRIVDTRTGSGKPDAGRTLAPGQSLTVPVAGQNGVPANATGVVLNVTVPDGGSFGYVTVYPSGSAVTKTTNVTYQAKTIAFDETTVALGSGGAFTVTNTSGGSTDVVIDLAGYFAPGQVAAYAYNGDGLRTSKTVGTTKTAFAYDQSTVEPSLLTDGSADYVYGAAGQPIAQITGSTVTYLSDDQLGSTTLLTGATGAVVGTYAYDAYGDVTGHTGTATTDLQYDGQYTDAETGFQYLRARYYDPSTAQFVSVDPLAALSGAAYGYASNDPVNLDDPTGLISFSGVMKWISAGSSFISGGASAIAIGCAVAAQLECTAPAELVALLSGGVAAVADFADAAYNGKLISNDTDLTLGLDLVGLGLGGFGKFILPEAARLGNISELAEKLSGIGLDAIGEELGWYLGLSTLRELRGEDKEKCK